MHSMSYQRKVGDYFFPELLVCEVVFEFLLLNPSFRELRKETESNLQAHHQLLLLPLTMIEDH
jgi:hypothetical protein